MKIIFLDIDGVLKTKQGLRRAFARHGRFIPDLLDDQAVRNLNRLIQATGAKIVITSTWRYGETITSLQQILNKKGILGTVIGKSPELGGMSDLPTHNISRGQEIDRWLEEHTEKINYVIIDDDNNLTPHQLPFAVICETENGLADNAKYELALKILCDKS
mgnify:CR=1 FL=1